MGQYLCFSATSRTTIGTRNHISILQNLLNRLITNFKELLQGKQGILSCYLFDFFLHFPISSLYFAMLCMG